MKLKNSNLQLRVNFERLLSIVKSQLLKVAPKAQRGVTVIELLIYMGILLILISVLSTIFATIIDTQLESKATSSVDQDGRYILTKLAYDMEAADAIASPSAGVQGTVLQVSINSINNTYNLDGSGNLQITNSNGTNNLNGYDTTISNLSFKRIGNDTVQVTFTTTSKTKKRTGIQNESKTFQTTLGIQ